MHTGISVGACLSERERSCGNGRVQEEMAETVCRYTQFHVVVCTGLEGKKRVQGTPGQTLKALRSFAGSMSRDLLHLQVTWMNFL